VIIPSIHAGIVQLLKINIFVENNISPNQTQDWIRHLMTLHEVNDCICGLLGSKGLPKFLCSLKVFITFSGFKKLFEVGSLSKDAHGYGHWFWSGKLKDFHKIVNISKL